MVYTRIYYYVFSKRKNCCCNLKTENYNAIISLKCCRWFCFFWWWLLLLLQSHWGLTFSYANDSMSLEMIVHVSDKSLECIAVRILKTYLVIIRCGGNDNLWSTQPNPKHDGRGGWGWVHWSCCELSRDNSHSRGSLDKGMCDESTEHMISNLEWHQPRWLNFGHAAMPRFKGGFTAVSSMRSKAVSHLDFWSSNSRQKSFVELKFYVNTQYTTRPLGHSILWSLNLSLSYTDAMRIFHNVTEPN